MNFLLRIQIWINLFLSLHYIQHRFLRMFFPTQNTLPHYICSLSCLFCVASCLGHMDSTCISYTPWNLLGVSPLYRSRGLNSALIVSADSQSHPSSHWYVFFDSWAHLQQELFPQESMTQNYGGTTRQEKRGGPIRVCGLVFMSPLSISSHGASLLQGQYLFRPPVGAHRAGLVFQLLFQESDSSPWPAFFPLLRGLICTPFGFPLHR